MALFERSRYVWNEPWFFQQRTRTTASWVKFILFLVACAVAVSATFYFSAPAGQPKNWLEIIGMGVGFSAAIWWLFDGVETRRQAVLHEDSLIVGGDMGKYSHPTTYKLSAIDGMAIVLPEESKWPEPALFFHYDGEEQAIGIDAKVGLQRVAQAIHDLGIPIRLDGWQPDSESAFERAYRWERQGDVTERATMHDLPEGTPSMMNVGGILLAIFRQCWAIGLWLALTIYLGYYGYQNWNQLGFVRMALIIAVPIAALYVAGTYTDRIATAATSFGLTKMALEQLRKREGVQVNLDSPEILPVEILELDQMEKTIQVLYEMGFLEANQTECCLFFEGKKQRWRIPAGAIISVQLEEIQTGTPGQSAMGTLNYFVVLTFQADEERKLALRDGQRDFGEYDDKKRAEGGVYVFEAIESVLA